MEIVITIPEIGKPFGIECKFCDYHRLTYITKIQKDTLLWQSLAPNPKFNLWILSIGNNNPITVQQTIEDLKSYQQKDKINTIHITIAKRNDSTRTTLQEYRAAFQQM